MTAIETTKRANASRTLAIVHSPDLTGQRYGQWLILSESFEAFYSDMVAAIRDEQFGE
jgi:hypothetical protein